jgi:site-specific DNA-methyltransferase (adenine-specific)
MDDFQKKLNSIIHGDNVEVLSKFPNECIDLCVTSPPYDTIRNYNNKLNTKIDSLQNYSFPFESLAKELYRTLKMGGVIVWVVGDGVVPGYDGGTTETGSSLKQALYFQQIGLNIHDTMIYQKPFVRFPDTTRYHQCFEYMFILSKGKPKTINFIRDKLNKCYRSNALYGVVRNKRDQNDDLNPVDTFYAPIDKFGRRTNVWLINPEQTTNREITEWNWHPAIFPSSLAYDHIITWSNKNDIVLDPFSGSGTTAVQAKKSQRQYIGIDINLEYVDKSNLILSNYGTIDNEMTNDDGKIINLFEF